MTGVQTCALPICLVEAVNQMLAYDGDIEIAIEPKPNEPMDQAYIQIGRASCRERVYCEV